MTVEGHEKDGHLKIKKKINATWIFHLISTWFFPGARSVPPIKKNYLKKINVNPLMLFKNINANLVELKKRREKS